MAPAPTADATFPKTGGMDAALVAQLLADGALPWTGAQALTDVTRALADPAQRAAALGAVVGALLPLRPQLLATLGRPVQEALCATCARSTARKGSSAALHGAVVAPREGRGRALVAASAPLARGAVVLRDLPQEQVVLADGPKTAKGGACRFGSGSLSPETALALRLWRGVSGCSAAAPRVAIEALLHHGGEDPQRRVERSAVAVACALVAAADQGANEEEQLDQVKVTSDAEALFVWLGRVRINAVAVTSVADVDGAMQVVKSALALFPTLASSVNHDCQPNALLRFQGDGAVEVVVCASGGVGPGEEITISYGPTAATMPCADRQAVLSGQYGFTCTCSACKRAATEDFSWRARAEALDARAQAEAARGSWRAAAVASSAALASLREGYADGDVELAREECKLAGILLQAGEVPRARAAWAAAAAALEPVVTPEDPDLVEATEMLRRLPAAGVGVSAGAATANTNGARRKEKCVDAARKTEKHESRATGNTVVSDAFEGVVLGLESVLGPGETHMTDVGLEKDEHALRELQVRSPSEGAPVACGAMQEASAACGLDVLD
mmetsp:Transcript_107733/g.303511  ORF Transcript_107733/g.303511 Transcript_107733/m.303511 type:complete len:562 (+) Transcript_107733:91-1776(+)